jgi:hypothetical protein
MSLNSSVELKHIAARPGLVLRVCARLKGSFRVAKRFLAGSMAETENSGPVYDCTAVELQSYDGRRAQSALALNAEPSRRKMRNSSALLIFILSFFIHSCQASPASFLPGGCVTCQVSLRGALPLVGGREATHLLRLKGGRKGVSARHSSAEIAKKEVGFWLFGLHAPVIVFGGVRKASMLCPFRQARSSCSPVSAQWLYMFCCWN